MQKVFYWFVFVWLSLAARADLVILSNGVPDLVVAPPALPTSVVGRVLWDSVRRFEPLIGDSFLSLQIEDPFRTDFHGVTRDTLDRAVFHSLRTMAGNMVLWEVRVPNVSRAISDSVGSPEQDVINPFSMTPYMYGQSWWDRVESSHRVLFGLRPFNEDPYAYVAKGLPCGLLFNLRYYYYHFDSHKVELVAVMPMSKSMRLTTGVAYNSGARDSSWGGCAGKIQIEKTIFSDLSKSQTVIFGSARLGRQIDQEALPIIVIGITHHY